MKYSFIQFKKCNLVDVFLCFSLVSFLFFSSPTQAHWTECEAAFNRDQITTAQAWMVHYFNGYRSRFSMR